MDRRITSLIESYSLCRQSNGGFVANSIMPVQCHSKNTTTYDSLIYSQ